MGQNETIMSKYEKHHTNIVTGGEKQKVMRGRRKRHLKLSDMETPRINKWDLAVDKWLEKHE